MLIPYLLASVLAVVPIEDTPVSAWKVGNDREWKTLTVRVEDADGQPLANARVHAWAIRAGNGHGGWPQMLIGTAPQGLTNTEGIMMIPYPVGLSDLPGELRVVSQVSCQVTHAEYCGRNVHLDVPANGQVAPKKVVLERGHTLRVAGARVGTETPLDFCHVLMGHSYEEAWAPPRADVAGWTAVGPMAAKPRWFRVVRAAPGEPLEFSKPQVWDANEADTNERLVVLHPGVRLKGVVSENVPRPVASGHVVAWCASRRTAEEAQARLQPMWWIETTPILEDGTFEFESLPVGTLAQLYACADDWISAAPSDEKYQVCCEWVGAGEHEATMQTVFRYGQVQRLIGAVQNMELMMEEAGRVEVTCVTAAEVPVAQATVASWPNQYMVGGGSTIFCTRQSSQEQLKPNHHWADFDHTGRTPYHAMTDEFGKATLRMMPAGRQDVLAQSPGGLVLQTPVDVVAGETKQVELKLLPSK